MLRSGIFAVGLAGCGAAGARILFVRCCLKKGWSNERLNNYPDDTRYGLESGSASVSVGLEEEELLELQAPVEGGFEKGNDEAGTYCHVQLSSIFDEKHIEVSMQDNRNPDGLDVLPSGAEQKQEENVAGGGASEADAKVAKLQQQHDEDDAESQVLGVGFGSLGSRVEVKFQGTGWIVQWQRRCSETNKYMDIPGATEATYLLQLTDLGKIIRARCENIEGAGPDGVSYAYANGAMLTRLDPVLGAIVRLQSQVMAFPVIERNGKTGKVGKGRVLQLSGTHANLLSQEGAVVRHGLCRHWDGSFILSTTDDTRAVLVKFKAFKRKMIDIEFNSAKARQHAVHGWYHLWTSAAHRNAALIKTSLRPAKPAELLVGHKALRDDRRRMASEAGQQILGDGRSCATMPKAAGGSRQAKANDDCDAKPIDKKVSSLGKIFIRQYI